MARYGDDTVLSALFGAYRRTCPGVTGAVYDGDAFTLLQGALVTLFYHDAAAGEQVWNGAPYGQRAIRRSWTRREPTAGRCRPGT